MYASVPYVMIFCQGSRSLLIAVTWPPAAVEATNAAIEVHLRKKLFFRAYFCPLTEFRFYFCLVLISNDLLRKKLTAYLQQLLFCWTCWLLMLTDRVALPNNYTRSQWRGVSSRCLRRLGSSRMMLHTIQGIVLGGYNCWSALNTFFSGKLIAQQSHLFFICRLAYFQSNKGEDAIFHLTSFRTIFGFYSNHVAAILYFSLILFSWHSFLLGVMHVFCQYTILLSPAITPN